MAMRNESRIRKILPVNLMLEGRPCLVVGSGQIAARKVGHLLEAGAAVTVVGPEASDTIQQWAAEGCIQYRARPFRRSDLKGQRVVLAATDNLKVNGEVIRLCQQKGLLCSAADAHWTEADFLIPATLRGPRVTMTISTGGESCRRARLIKDYLARHIDILSSADLMVVSVDQSRGVAKRIILELGAVLQQIWGIHEFVIVNGANRLEVLAVVVPQVTVARLLRDSVRARCPGRCCIHEGAAAVEYVAESFFVEGEPRGGRVTAGENMSDALSESTQAGWAGVMMKEWIEAGLRLADKIRNARAKPAKTGACELAREYQRQYEKIIRSI